MANIAILAMLFQAIWFYFFTFCLQQIKLFVLSGSTFKILFTFATHLI